MNLKKIIASLTVFSLLTATTGCQLITKTPEAIKRTSVAEVDNREITKGEFDATYNSLLMQYKMIYPASTFTDTVLSQIKTSTLEQLINSNVLEYNAKQKKVYPTEKEINDEVKKDYDKTAKSVGGEQALIAKLKENSLTADDYKLYLKGGITDTKINAALKEQVKVADSEITTYYYSNQFEYTTNTDSMNVSYILVKTSAVANKVESLLKKGAKFETLAKQYSIDTSTKDKGGLLGDVKYNDTNIDSSFLTAGIATPAGKITPPIYSSKFGYFVIKVNSKKEYPMKKLATVKSEIKAKIQQTNVETMLKGWVSKAKITKHTDRL